MKSTEVEEFITHYRQNNGNIKDPKFLQTDIALKLKWVDIAHSLDALCRSIDPKWPVPIR